ncbi:hypothetical protein AVEN_84616-1 [Araneus ventricosus]|uniref:Uncharacterized protein n=1 Tax=Araneus ventricosus TaxID=182803 RepID=A0A4Y2C475_ARAVE|nr:hypothetical protein AVEN_84616-1 [Araneus ventricosus]
MQVRPMVTSKLALTFCKLVPHLHSCRVKLAASLQICSASLLQTKIAIWVSRKKPVAQLISSASRLPLYPMDTIRRWRSVEQSRNQLQPFS